MNAIRDGNHIRIYDAFLAKESIKEIDGRFYDPDDKAWVVPYSKENVALLQLLGASLDDIPWTAGPMPRLSASPATTSAGSADLRSSQNGVWYEH